MIDTKRHLTKSDKSLEETRNGQYIPQKKKVYKTNIKAELFSILRTELFL